MAKKMWVDVIVFKVTYKAMKVTKDTNSVLKSLFA
jgi:hypothetical protein